MKKNPLAIFPKGSHINKATFEPKNNPYFYLGFYLVKDDVILGAATAIVNPHNPEIRPRYVWARPGFGLFTYLILSKLSGDKKIYPSDSLSNDAERFWTKNKEGIHYTEQIWGTTTNGVPFPKIITPKGLDVFEIEEFIEGFLDGNED